MENVDYDKDIILIEEDIEDDPIRPGILNNYELDNIFYIIDNITMETYRDVVNFLNSKGKDDKLLFVLCSGGGDRIACYAIFNLMQFYNIDTLGNGYIASGAILLFASGRKRYIIRNTEVALHDILYTQDEGASNRYNDLKAERKDLDKTYKNYIKLLAGVSKMSEKELYKKFESDELIYLTINEVIKYGFADRII